MITTQKQTISPKRAGEILDRHYERIEKGQFAQRNVSPSLIERYASDMRLNMWRLTPQPIAFDTNGDLIDGQHRLEAVRKSGKDIEFMVSTGWDAEDSRKQEQALIDVIDTGKTRSVDQMMHLKGFHSAKNFASAARFAVRVVHNGGSGATSFSNIMWLLNKEGLRDSIERIMSVSVSHRDFLGPVVGPLAYYHTAHPKKALEFAEQYFNHTAVKGSAVHLFYKWQSNRGPTPTHVRVKAFCSAIRGFHNNMEGEVLKPTTEGIQWLAGVNPGLRERIRKNIPRSQRGAATR